MCVTGLEASEGASQASGGCKQAAAHSRNHTSSSPASGTNPPAAGQKALSSASGAGGDLGGGHQTLVQTSCSQSGGISTVSTSDSATGL